MTLTELRFLVALADECHFGRAALRLGVSQPALSSALRKLEDGLGYALFERNRRGVRATAAAAPLLVQARQILAQLEQLRAIAQQDTEQLRAPVALGAPASLGPFLYPQLLMQLSDIWSLTSFGLVEAPQAELLVQLLDGQLDAALLEQSSASPSLLTKDLVTLALFKEPLALLVGAEHPLAASASITPGQLADQQLLYVATEPTMASALPAGLQAPLHACSSLESLRQLVLAGQGIGLVPVLVAGAWLLQAPRLVVRSLQPPLPERHWVLAWRASYPRHKVIDRLQQALQSAVAWQLSSLTQGAHTPLAQDHGDW